MTEMTFSFFDKNESEKILPEMYDILFTNMNNIAPTGNSYETDKKIWLSFMLPSIEKGNKHIILMYVDKTLAGYFQYNINGDVMMVEDIQIKPEFHRTMLFCGFFKYFINIVPRNVVCIEANIHKNNMNSQTIAKKLGMQIVGENKNKISWHLKGTMDKFKGYAKSK